MLEARCVFDWETAVADEERDDQNIMTTRCLMSAPDGSVVLSVQSEWIIITGHWRT